MRAKSLVGGFRSLISSARRSCVVLFVTLGGCAGGPDDAGEELGHVSQATTQTCSTLPLPGECRYSPVQAFASSTETSGSIHAPSNAIDGLCGTRWSSAFRDPQWLKVDLGAKRPLSRVVVRWESAASADYRIEVSDDANHWTTVAQDENAVKTGSGNSRVDTISGLTASARYLRLYSLARATNYGNSIFELEVFGTGCGVTPGCSQVPVFVSGASASSVQHSEKGPEKAIDGSSSTRWSSAFSDPQWIALDLGSSQTVHRAVLDWEAASSAKYEIQTSDSPSGPWTVAATKDDSRVGPRTDDVSGFTASGRYLRIYSRKRTTNYGVSLFEIRLFRQSCGACEQLLVPTTTAASSTESNNYPSAHAVDGDYGSRWSSKFSDPQWLRLDFGEERRLKQLIVKWESASSKSYRVESSASANGPWKVLAERVNQPAGARVDTIGNLSAVTRFLRIYSTARTTTYGNSIFEVVALGSSNPVACGGECFLGDSDHDTVNDCLDACPDDPTKVEPGICGCGVPDSDDDHDGVPNCFDDVDDAPSDQSVGDCGTPTAPASATTRCNDGVCPGVHFCNGAGICGNPAGCRPAPSCVEKQVGERWYWFCSGAFSWQEARSRCAGWPGTLAVIGDARENALLAANLPGPTAWIAANDIVVEGRWRWANLTSDGNRFWDGASQGRPYFEAFSKWNAGFPSESHACGALSTGGGWISDSCSAGKGFICERASYGPTIGGPPGPMGSPTPGPCVAASTAFPNATGTGEMSKAEWDAALARCDAACRPPAGGDDEACTAACANGPLARATSDNCSAFSDKELQASCLLEAPSLPLVACTDDATCRARDPNTVCGYYYACRSADTPENQRIDCFSEGPFVDPEQRTVKICGFAVAGCAREAADFTGACDEVQLCTDPAMQQTLLNPFDQASFAAQAFDPSSYFSEPAEPDPTVPFPDQGDPCGGACTNQGVDHPWCHLGTGPQLPAAPPVNGDKSGDSGGDLVSFQIDPKLSLTYHANVGPFGLPTPPPGEEHGLDVTAEAGFLARVNYKIISEGSLDVIDVLARASAHECGIDTEGTLSILEFDFAPLVKDRALPDDFPTAASSARCKQAFQALQQAGDRAKKAMRDAAELIRQYNAMLANDGQPGGGLLDNFNSSACQTLIEKAPRGFPPVDCSQGVEGAINGFIEYYRRTVLGFAGLDGAGAQLKGLTEQIDAFAQDALSYETGFDIPIFSIDPHDEEMTIAEFQFFIGPVPVNLELLTHVYYKATVNLTAVLRPGAVVKELLLNTGSKARQRLFFVQANGEPEAGVSLAAFAGVGFGVPGFTAKIGIESELNLAGVQVPVHAGAGISLGATPELERPLGADLKDITTGAMLLQPKRYVLGLEYGAGLDIRLRNILGGTIKGKLKLKLLFWSKTWQKTLLEFNGLCPGDFDNLAGALGQPPCTIPLISLDGSGELASDGFPWGVVQPSTPFVQFKPLVPNTMQGGLANVSTARVEEFFYDSQCECMTRADPRDCFRDDDCCGEDICFEELTGGRSTCQGCRENLFTCRETSDCCEGTRCLPITTGPAKQCKACQGRNWACDSNDECCDGTTCIAGLCVPFSDCDGACDDDADCRHGADPTAPMTCRTNQTCTAGSLICPRPPG